MDKVYLVVDEVVEDLQRWDAYIVEVMRCDNLIKRLTPRYKNGKIYFVNICKNKKHAEQVVNEWNKDHKENKTNLINY